MRKNHFHTQCERIQTSIGDAQFRLASAATPAEEIQKAHYIGREKRSDGIQEAFSLQKHENEQNLHIFYVLVAFDMLSTQLVTRLLTLVITMRYLLGHCTTITSSKAYYQYVTSISQK
mmetsp:Transcript_10413/g.30458  ORF Transcript_10413/g.30458 Transcript_10413/m.30458 type:complete len:118 (+) Transcript_10413:1088-1441(+)